MRYEPVEKCEGCLKGHEPLENYDGWRLCPACLALWTKIAERRREKEAQRPGFTGYGQLLRREELRAKRWARGDYQSYTDSEAEAREAR